MSKKAKSASRSRRGALVPRAILDKREANVPSTSGSTLNAETLLADLRSLFHSVSARQRGVTVANSGADDALFPRWPAPVKGESPGGEGSPTGSEFLWQCHKY